MVKIGHIRLYFWSEKEKALHNTERHQVFVKELYSCYKGNRHISRKEFQERLKEFKEKNFDLLEVKK